MFDYPLIDPGYFSDKEGLDLQVSKTLYSIFLGVVRLWLVLIRLS